MRTKNYYIVIPILLFLGISVFLTTISRFAYAKEEKTLNFNTKSIRILWMACFKGGHQGQQKIPSDAVALVCDCVIDKARTQLSFEYTTRNAGPIMKKVYRRYLQQCKEEVDSTLKPSLSA